MLRKITALLMVFLLCVLLCACGENGDNTSDLNLTEVPVVTTAPVDEKTPEEIAEEFVRAIYMGDLDGFLAYIPEFTYDMIIYLGDIEIEEGADKVSAVRDYFEGVMSEEPEDLATEVNIETRISETMNMDTYLNTVKDVYVSEGFVTEEVFQEIEDVVFVEFNADGKYASGEEFSLTDFEGHLPCVKIDGKWYAEFVYLTVVPVQLDTEIMTGSVQQ